MMTVWKHIERVELSFSSGIECLAVRRYVWENKFLIVLILTNIIINYKINFNNNTKEKL